MLIYYTTSRQNIFLVQLYPEVRDETKTLSGLTTTATGALKEGTRGMESELIYGNLQVIVTWQGSANISFRVP